VETQERSSPSVTQSESYRIRTQHIMDRSNAGSDAAREKQPPSSQIHKAKHPPEVRQRSASSALPPPETSGIETEPSVVVDTTEDVFTHRMPTAPALFDKLGTSTPEAYSSPALTFLRTTVLGKELREAIEKGEIARVRDLVRVGADIENMNDRNGLTAMHYASSYGHKNIIEILLDSGANIHAYDAKKATPLHSAASGGYSDITRLLLDRGAVIDEKDEHGWTPFHKAAHNGHVSVARELLESGADINAQEFRGLTALHIAAFYNKKDIVSLLLAADAIVNVRDRNDCTALYAAAQENSEDTVSLLLAANADINAQACGGLTALHIAAFDNKKGIVSLLLAAGADVTLDTAMGMTALHSAAYSGHVEVVFTLLQTAINVWAKNNRGKTALDLAKEKGHSEVIVLLEKPRGTGKIDSKKAVPVTKEEGKKKARQAFFSKRKGHSGETDRDTWVKMEVLR